MPRKKTPPAAKPESILPDELLEKLIPSPMDAAGVEAVFQKLKKAVIERALGAELGVHLASPEGGRYESWGQRKISTFTKSRAKPDSTFRPSPTRLRS
jgi:hypothetical protein